MKKNLTHCLIADGDVCSAGIAICDNTQLHHSSHPLVSADN